MLQEVTALGHEGRLLLFCYLNNQTRQADKYKTKLEQFIVCDHIDHPLSLDQGREVSPLGFRGQPPTVIGSTVITIAHLFPNCNKNRPGATNTEAVKDAL